MPHIVYECDWCDYTHKKKQKVKNHERIDCISGKVCSTCKHLDFWWGTYQCDGKKSIYNGTLIIDDVRHSHSCDNWKRKK